jgi:hypothetical protein
MGVGTGVIPAAGVIPGVGVGVGAPNAADTESVSAPNAAHGVIRGAVFMLRPRLKNKRLAAGRLL